MSTTEVIKMRQKHEDTLERLASATIRYTRRMQSLVHPTVRRVLTQWNKKHAKRVEYNIGFMYTLLKWSKYPNVNFVWTMLEGAPMVGLLKETGIYPKDKKLATKIKKAKNVDDILKECEKVNKKILQQMKKQDTEHDEVLWTASEVEQDNGIMTQHFDSMHSLKSWIETNLPTRENHVGQFLLAPRFACVQARPKYDALKKRTEMVSKTRPIDNAKVSGVNAAFVTEEKGWLPTLNAIGIQSVVAEHFAREDEKFSLNCFALDESSAYRSVPCKPEDQALLVTTQRCPKTGEIRFSILHSMIFGASGSVSSYGQKGFALEHVCRCLGCPCMRYMDDYWSIEAAARVASNKSLMGKTATCSGTLMTCDKEQVENSQMTLLGCSIDFQKFSCEHTECKLGQRCMELRNYLETDKMSGSDAERQFSRTLWSKCMLSANEFEMAEILDLFRERRWQRDNHGDKLYPALRKAIERLIVLYETSGPVKFSSMIPVEASFPQISWSDGMQEEDLDKCMKSKTPFGIGAVVCNRTGDKVNEFIYATGAVKHDILVKWFEMSGKTLKRCIMGVELVGLLELLNNASMVNVIRGKHTIHFIDNVGAWACLTRAASRMKTYDGLVRLIHQKLADIGCRMHFLFVPTFQNVADIPSRLEEGEKQKTLQELHDVLKGWKHRQVEDL